MNAVMTQVASQEYLRRSEAIKRRNAEDAYDRTSNYNGNHQKTLSKLEAMLIGKEELPQTESSPKKVDKLDAGQVKQIALPLGNTLEETIDLWRDVRSEANSVLEPTTADHQLAAKASAEIRDAEAQLSLNDQRQLDKPVQVDLQAAFTSPPTKEAIEAREIQKRYEKAISSYSFQAQAKRNGYQVDWPSFYKAA